MCINNESEYPFIAARSIYPEKLQNQQFGIVTIEPSLLENSINEV